MGDGDGGCGDVYVAATADGRLCSGALWAPRLLSERKAVEAKGFRYEYKHLSGLRHCEASAVAECRGNPFSLLSFPSCRFFRLFPFLRVCRGVVIIIIQYNNFVVVIERRRAVENVHIP